MTERFLLGIDAGSSVCKAAIFDLEGRQKAIASCRTPLSRPTRGAVELDPELAWNATVSVIRDVVADSGIDTGKIEGIGLSAAMVGAWLVDANGKALRPGINWEDSRSQTILDRMKIDHPDFMSRIFQSTGSVLQQGCTLPVLAWLKENEPEVIAETAHVFGYKDYLRLRLTGIAATDRSEASVIPGDARIRNRSDEMISLFGLTDLAGLLPDVRDSETLAGGLTAEAAALTGLPEGLPVAIGAGDVAATIIGIGGLRAGAATAVLGTTCMVGICHDRPVFTPPDVGLLFSLPGDCWYRSMVNVAGTLNLDWAIELLATEMAEKPDRFERIAELAQSVPAGSRGLTYLPYLSESGIVAPVVAPQARAQFCGLIATHGRAEMLRAVYEGVAFAFLDLVRALEFEGNRLMLAGGGGKSPFWAQMIADVLDKTVVVPTGSEFGARGAALLAATALGYFPDIRAASLSVGGDGVLYHPAPKSSAAYRPAFLRYMDCKTRHLA
jgi:sugar (pentulose or hexulose) kinase